jgi:hypothetical protein
MTKPTKPPLQLNPLAQGATSSEELARRLENAADWTAQAELKPGVTPWANAHPKMKVNFLYRMSEELHLKLKFIVEHEPQTSMQKLVNEAVEAEVERRLRKFR